MLVDYHMHLERGPFAPDWLARFLAVAAERGVGEIGISEHIYRFDEAQAAYGAWWDDAEDAGGAPGPPPAAAPASGVATMPRREVAPGTRAFAAAWWTGRGGQSLGEYAGLLRDAAAAGLPVRCGIEADYFPGREDAIRGVLRQAPFDYVIGSVHWIGAWGFDLLDVPGLWDGRDVDAAYRAYFALLGRAARSGLFDIMAHPDLIKVMGHRPSPALALDAHYEEAAAAFAAGGVAVEVSTAGLRKPVGELYPAPAFLRACRRRGVPLSLASDAHRPEDVGADFDRAVALARDCGYREFLTFAARQSRPAPM
jgi:histidinol-phosphatase (PHP family)